LCLLFVAGCASTPTSKEANAAAAVKRELMGKMIEAARQRLERDGFAVGEPYEFLSGTFVPIAREGTPLVLRLWVGNPTPGNPPQVEPGGSSRAAQIVNAAEMRSPPDLPKQEFDKLLAEAGVSDPKVFLTSSASAESALWAMLIPAKFAEGLASGLVTAGLFLIGPSDAPDFMKIPHGYAYHNG
jgi:hypothetical protein